MRQYLSQEIPPLTLKNLIKAGRWIMEGLWVLCPTPLRQMFWRDIGLFTDLSGDQVLTHRLLRAWSGDEKINVSPSNLKDDTNYHRIALKTSDIFETSLSLPIEARGSLSEALGLQLDQVSPLDVQDTSFAIGEVSKGDDERLTVDIAITHQKTVKSLQETSVAKILDIGACSDDKGQLRYIFKTNQEPLTDKQSNPVLIFIIWLAAIVILIGGIEIHLGKRRANMLAHEQALVAELKQIRAGVDFADVITGASFERITRINVAELMQRLQQKTDLLPTGVILSRVSLSPSENTFKGYGVIGHEYEGVFVDVTRQPSTYEGYETFEVKISGEGL